jgi:hypothetical protein
VRFYLSGGMEYASDEGRDWRSEMQLWLAGELGATVFNPNVESDRLFSHKYAGVDFRAMKSADPSGYRAIASDLVDIDCGEIAGKTDVVLCYWDASAMRGAGTKGELTMARYFHKPVYMVTSMPFTEIPGWVLGCTDRMFGSFEELKRFLKGQAEGPGA